MFKRLLIFLLTGLLLLTACNGASKTTANLRGRLFVKDPDFAMPAPDNAIYLVPLTADQTVMTVPTIEFSTAIQAKVENTTGKFVFSNVPVGKYLVMVVTTSSSQIPAYTPEGSLAVVDVKDSHLGKTTDLGNYVVP
jgi:hypothetical protein